MKETKSLTVPPEAEVDEINFWQAFGWTLFSTQEVLSESSHLEQGYHFYDSDTVYSVREKKHYIKLTFQRDPEEVKHYTELKQLENDLNNVPYPASPGEPFGAGSILIGLLLCGIPGLIMIIRNMSLSGDQDNYLKKVKEYHEKCNEIYQKAVAISSSK